MRVLAASICVMIICTTAFAADDPIKAKLDRAKSTYQSDFDAYKKAVENYFTGREESARKAGDKQTLDKIKSDRQAFVDTGELPNDAPANLKQRLTTAHNALDLAYRNAIKDYIRARQDDQANAVEEEMNAFDGASSGDKSADALWPADAIKSVGKTVTAQMTVQRAIQGKNLLWLHSGMVDGLDEIVFTLGGGAHDHFRPDPSVLLGRKVRVTGEVTMWRGKMYQMVIKDPDDVKILDPLPARTPPVNFRGRRIEFQVAAKKPWQQIGTITKGRYKLIATGKWSWDGKDFVNADGDGIARDPGTLILKVNDVAIYWVGQEKTLDLPAGTLYMEMKDGDFGDPKPKRDNAGQIDVVIEEVSH